MIRVHSMTYKALISDSCRAIRYMSTEYGMMRPFLGNEEVIVDDREPRNELVEKLCLAMQENEE